MQERQNRNQLQWFDQYRASKTVLFWACAGSAVLATVVGFSWGGWVTGGTAREMAEQSGAQARQEVAALVCVERFMAAPDMAAQLTALKGIDRSYQRDKFVEDGGWAIMPVGSSAEASTPGSSAESSQGGRPVRRGAHEARDPRGRGGRADQRPDDRGAIRGVAVVSAVGTGARHPQSGARRSG